MNGISCGRKQEGARFLTQPDVNPVMFRTYTAVTREEHKQGLLLISLEVWKPSKAPSKDNFPRRRGSFDVCLNEQSV